MKKLLLLSGFLLMGAGLTAQSQSAQIMKGQLKADLKKSLSNKVYSTGFEEIGKVEASTLKAPESVGITTYDLQSNASVSASLLESADGTLHTTWIYSESGDIGAPDRGTGYNSYNGAWGPTPASRIDAERVGWPSLFETADGTIGVVAHTGGDGLMVTKRAPGGAWTSALIPDDTGAVWGRVASDGDNVHVITSRNQTFFDDMDGGLVYRRSTDGANTWSAPILLPGIVDLMASVRADDYAIDVTGDIVAVTVGGYGKQTVLIKSTDNGDSWTSSIVSPVTTPLEEDSPNFEPAFCANSLDVVIDGSGTAHIVYATYFNNYSEADAGVVYYPNLSQVLYYWNEGMAAPLAIPGTFRQDLNGDGDNYVGEEEEVNTYAGGSIDHPTIGLHTDGTIYVAYDAAIEDAVDADGVNILRDVYMVKSTDGMNWEGPLNVSNDSASEAAFPVLPAHFSSAMVPIQYQNDEFGGIAVQDIQSTYVENQMQVDMIDPATIVDPSYDPATNIPLTTTLWAGFGVAQGCDVDLDFWGLYAFDFPDGALEMQYTDNEGNQPDFSVAGEIEMFFFAVDSDGNQSEIDTIAITVIEDLEPPVLELIGAPVTAVQLGDSYTDAGVTYFDNSGCDLDNQINVSTDLDLGTVGSYTYTYNVTDFAGNAADEITRTVNVIEEDTSGPVVTVDGGNELTFDASNQTFDCPGFTAFDDLDGDVSANVVVEGCDDVNLLIEGTYTITFTVTDNAGNPTVETVTVTVVDSSAPQLFVPGNVTVYDLECGDALPTINILASDNGAQLPLVEGQNLTISGTVPANTNGSFPLTYVATDANGNDSDPLVITINVTGCQVGISSIFGGIVEIAPNPTNGNITVDLSSTNVKTAEIAIYDINGRLMSNELVENTGFATRLDLSTFANGVYMIQVNTDLGSMTEKVILNK